MRSESPNPSVVAPPAAWGVRKRGSVLFADVAESTGLIADLDPEEAMEALEPSVRLMSAVAKRFDASVVQTLGDGIMAVFGVPLAREGHALLACQAALTIQQALEESGLRVSVRIGIHTGDLVVSNVEKTMEPMPHGAAVHLASRLEKLAPPGSICISDACYDEVKLHCDATPLGAHKVRGFDSPVETFSLVGMKPAITSEQFHRRGLVPLRGREGELGQLCAALEDVRAGRGRVVGISGTAGTGKSRLCYEFAQMCRAQNVPVLEAQALISKEATPLQPIIEFVRLSLGVSMADQRDAAIERVRQHPAVAFLDSEEDVRLLCQFIGLYRTDEVPPPRGSKTRASAIRKILRRIVHEIGSRPNVLIFEDLHWLDIGSAEFVAEVVEAVRDTQTLLVVNYRPDFAAEWTRSEHFTEIPLDSLRSEHVEKMLADMLGVDPDTAKIRRSIATRCAGNPFFAEELVRSLANTGVLAGGNGRYRAVSAVNGDFLPASVQETICVRIDGLSPQERSLVHIAAVIGKDFPMSILGRITDLPPAVLDASVERLVRAQIFRPKTGSAGSEFGFIHPLFQETAYNVQLKSRRALIHSTIATALEQQYGEGVDEFSALIAHHLEAAGDFVHAAEFAARAAVWVGSANSSQAVKHWRDVRRLLDGQPSAPERDKLRMRASGQIAMFGWRVGMTAEEAKPFISEALEWARKCDDSKTSLLLAADGRIAVSSGYSADYYVARSEEALLADDARNDPGRTATISAFLCHANLLAGFLERALEANERALAGASHVTTFDEQFLGLNIEQWMQCLRGRILVRLGRFAEAMQPLDALLAIERSMLDPAVRFIPHLAYVDLAYFRNDAALAAEHSERIGEISRRGRNPYLTVYAHGCLGVARILRGDYEGGIRTLRRAIDFCQEAKAALEFEPEMMSTLADAYLRSGAVVEAANTAQQAIDLAILRGARMAECRARLTLGAALPERNGGRTAEIAGEAARARQLIDVTGARVIASTLTI